MAFWASEQKAGQTGWQEVLLWLLCANKGTQHENLIPHLAIWGNLPSCSDQRAHLTTWGSSQGALGAWLQINVVVERFLRLLDPFQYVWYEKFVRQYDEWNQNYINLTWGCGMITNQFKIGQSTSQVAGLKKYDSKITQLVGKWPQHKREKLWKPREKIKWKYDWLVTKSKQVRYKHDWKFPQHTTGCWSCVLGQYRACRQQWMVLGGTESVYCSTS